MCHRLVPSFWGRVKRGLDLTAWRELIGSDDAHWHLIHDRDGTFARPLDESIRVLGMNVLKSPPWSIAMML